MKTLQAVLLSSVALCTGSCGYHVAGKADLMPKSVKTIAVPAFTNVTTRYKLTDRLPEDIAREFNGRTRYRVVSDPNTADAVLKGSVINYISFPAITDQVTGRATAVDLRVYLQVSLTERATGKVLFTRPSMEVRERYQISIPEGPYFDESDAALNRLSKQVAQQLVTAVLDNF
jgi:outer membrane lipopolysaccharide assembly protein LptE/RlpB